MRSTISNNQTNIDIIEQIKILIENNPNDMDLGSKLRKMFN